MLTLMKFLWLVFAVVVAVVATRQGADAVKGTVKSNKWAQHGSLAFVESSPKGVTRRTVLRRLLDSADGIETAACDTQCQASQRQALTQLYTSWAGPGWTRQQNWLKDGVHACQWQGVLCCLVDTLGADGAEDIILESSGDPQCPDSATGVVGISLASNNMTGDVAALPWDAFGPTLMLLVLEENALFGSTQAWAAGGGLASLSRLRFISLGGNRLTGPLEPLTELPNLTAALLHSNRLSGTLPPALLTHGPLQYLNLDDNALSGGLPAELFLNSSGLRDVHLAKNALSGGFPELPAGAALAANLDYLDVSRNTLTGGLPRYLSLILLSYLDASANRLDGPVGPLLSGSWSLYHVALRNNSLNGSIPDDLRCRHVQVLDLSHNALTGTLPPVLGSLRDLATLLLNGNPGLRGALPGAIGAAGALEYLDIRGTAMQAAAPGAAGLPASMTLSNTTIDVGGDEAGPRCPFAELRDGREVGVPPFYWHYAGCACAPGFTPNLTRAPAPAPASSGASGGGAASAAVVSMACVHDGGQPPGGRSLMSWWAVVIIVVGGLVLLGAVLLLVYRLLPSVVRYRAALAKRMPPGFSRRARGCVVTLVLTDVEGSTELWEWDTDLMAAAIDLHDHTLRSQMGKWYGYEVQTEGDAFLMAFHEPADAVGWCITTQLALLNADWDRELFRHHKACIETLYSLQPSSHPPSNHGGQISAIGPAGQSGPVALQHAPGSPGGAQRTGLPAGIFLGPPAGNSGMSSVRVVTPPRMSANGVEEAAGPGPPGGSAAGGGGGHAAGSSGTVPTAGGGGGGPGSLDNSKQIKGLGNGMKHNDMTFGGVTNAAEFADWTRYTRLQVLYRGLRVRMGVATGVTDAITSHAITQRMEYSGEVYRRVQAVADLPNGGQILLDANTFNAIHNNLNELGVRTIQVLTRDKRRSGGGGTGGVRSAAVGLRGASFDLLRTHARGGRQSLQLASAAEAAEVAEPPEPAPSLGLDLAAAINEAAGGGASGVEEEGGGGFAAAAAAAAAAGGDELQFGPSSARSAHGSPGWGGRGSARETRSIHSLWARVGSGLSRVSTFGRNSLRPATTGSEISSRSPWVASASGNRGAAPAAAGQPQAGPHRQQQQQQRELPLQLLQRSPTGTAPGALGPASSAPSSAAPTTPLGRSVPAAVPAQPSHTSGGRSAGGESTAGGVQARALDPSRSVAVLESHESSSREHLSMAAALPHGGGGAAGLPSASRSQPPDCCGGGAGAAGAAGGAAEGNGVGVGHGSASDAESQQQLGSTAAPRVGHLREVPTGPLSQAAPATRATLALNALAREAITRRTSMAPAIAVVNMGVFELHAGGNVEYVNITQVLVPGLEERARLGKPLDGSRQLTPGYFNAPATSVAPLGALRPGSLARVGFPPVTLVFCSMERYSDMTAVNRDLALDVMAAYNDCVRRSLIAVNGYECQEQEGNYMIAFARPSEALEWCLMLQEVMMEVAWSPPMLALPSMHEELHPLTGAVLFRGPRIKAGMYQGVPTRVSPHSTTGRADYFGPLVNRAARYCHAAAQGGQVIISRPLVEDILRELLRDAFVAAERVPPEELPVRNVAVIDNSNVPPPRWCMPQDVGASEGGAGGAGGRGGGGGGAPRRPSAVYVGAGSAGPRRGSTGVGVSRAASAARGGERPSNHGGNTDGASSPGSVVVLPERPVSNVGFAFGGATWPGGHTGYERAANPYDRTTPTFGASVGGGRSESITAGAHTASAAAAPSAGASSPPASRTSSSPSLSSEAPSRTTATAGAAAAATAAPGSPPQPPPPDLADPRAADYDPEGGPGFPGFATVEVPLHELAMYDIQPASVPRRMRPAMEMALAEVRRAADAHHREQLHSQSQLGAAFASAMRNSRPGSRKSGSMAAAAAAATVASMMASSAGAGGLRSPTGSPWPRGLMAAAAHLPLAPHALPPPGPGAAAGPGPPSGSAAPLPLGPPPPSASGRIAMMRGSEPAYLDTPPLSQMSIQHDLDRGYRAQALGAMRNDSLPTMGRDLEPPTLQPPASLDLVSAFHGGHRPHSHRHRRRSSHSHAHAHAHTALASAGPLPQHSRGAHTAAGYASSPSAAPRSSPPHPQPLALVGGQVSQRQQQQQQQQQHPQLGPAAAPGSLPASHSHRYAAYRVIGPAPAHAAPQPIPSGAHAPGHGYPPAHVQGPQGPPSPLLQPQHQGSGAWREGVSSAAQHSRTLQSMESMMSQEHSATFQALWEIATDDGGLRSGASRVDFHDPASAAVGGSSSVAPTGRGSLELGSAAALTYTPDRPRLPAALRASADRAPHRSSFMMLESAPGCLPTLPELCIRRRMGPYKWLWAHELVVEDLGLFRFKGVAGNHAIVSVSTAGTSERKLGSRMKKTKGERVEPGKGLLYRVMLRPTDLPSRLLPHESFMRPAPGGSAAGGVAAAGAGAEESGALPRSAQALLPAQAAQAAQAAPAVTQGAGAAAAGGNNAPRLRPTSPLAPAPAQPQQQQEHVRTRALSLGGAR